MHLPGTPRHDLQLWESRQARAGRMRAPDAGFLERLVLDELVLRLGAVQREFRTVLVFCSPTTRPDLALAGHLPDAQIERNAEFASLAAGGGFETALAEARYDLAVSVFGLHWVPDPVAVLAEVRRALKPDGLFMGIIPGAGTLAELRDSILAAEAEAAGGAARRVDAFPRLSDSGQLLHAAGYALPVADVESHTFSYAGLTPLLAELRSLGATNVGTDARRPLPKSAPALAESVYLRDHSDEKRRLLATLNLHFLSGWSPHESQQKPLAPGSAEVSLTRVLKR